ncbi:hypothetical protein LCGC14_0787720 [marine sediment metagenome]|uniref:Uncharacterized protein n=1 Tax=marine sediment metagenome TaxID=412755 RepID=A0A0F9T0M6_9ZZZZ
MKRLSDDNEAIKKLIKQTGWGLKRAESLNLVSNYKSVAREAEDRMIEQVVELLEGPMSLIKAIQKLKQSLKQK